VFRRLAELRAAPVAAGQEPWQRCDLGVSRVTTTTADPQLSIAFAYRVRVVPE